MLEKFKTLLIFSGLISAMVAFVDFFYFDTGICDFALDVAVVSVVLEFILDRNKTKINDK